MTDPCLDQRVVVGQYPLALKMTVGPQVAEGAGGKDNVELQEVAEMSRSSLEHADHLEVGEKKAEAEATFWIQRMTSLTIEVGLGDCTTEGRISCGAMQ